MLRRRSPGRTLWLTAALASAWPLGCSIDDRKLSDANCSRDGGNCQPGSFTITIASPSAATYTNGTVDVQVTVAGASPEQIELTLNGSRLATLSAPFQFAWDTTKTGEGEYTLVASARDGQETIESQQVKVFVDRTPPTVASHTPLKNDSNLFIDDPIEVKFDEPIVMPAPAADTVTVTAAGKKVASTLALSENDTILRVSPAPYAPATVSVALAATLTDRAGNPITPYSWQFEIPGWQDLGKVATAAYAPQVAVASDGKLYVAYQGGDAAGHVARLNGKSWEPFGPELKNDVAGVNASDLSIVARAPDEPVVALTLSGNGSTEVHVLRWSGTDWAPVGTPQKAQTDGAFNPELALGKDGTIYMGMLGQASGGSYSVHAAKWNENGWQYLGGAANGSAHVGTASIAFALAANDVPHVAYYDYSNQTSQILLQRWTGSAWQSAAPATRFNTGASISDPSLVADASGVLHLGVSELVGPNALDYAARQTSGAFAAIGDPLSRAAQQSFATRTPAIAVDASGRVTLVGKVMDGSFVALAARRFESAAWRSFGNLSAFPRVRDVEGVPSLKLTSKGRAVVAFSQSDGNNSNTYVYRSNF